MSRFAARAGYVLAILAVSAAGFAAPDTALADDMVFAGMASVDVTPVIGVPLGGYGGGDRRVKGIAFHRWAHLLKPSIGVHDPIRSKALIIKNGSKKLLFISLDVVGVTEAFYLDLISRLKPLGFAENEIFVSATHTHSGPGTLSHEWLWELLAMDLYQKKIYNRFVEGILKSVQEAYAAMEPAKVLSLTFTAQNIQRNRRGHTGLFDPTTNALLLLSERGQWLGAMVNIAVHGTSLDTDNFYFSADTPGALERAVEARLARLSGGNPTVMFVNGSEGDVSPTEFGFDGLDVIGNRFADQFEAAMPGATAAATDWNVRSMVFELPKPKLTVKNCVAGTLRKLINWRIGLGHSISQEAHLSVIEMGDIKMMTWPGEPTTTLGLALKQAAKASGSTHPWVMGLTNGYMAYFTAPEEFDEGGYEACNSLYGRQGGEQLVGAITTNLLSKP